MNVLFITLDQFRGDCLSCAGHPLVETPNLDALAREGVRLARHYSQAAPCAPGRAALYTGTYQMNNRVVANGTPLDERFDNVARAARRAGYAPALFGYTDQGVDPRRVDDPLDPRLSTYEGVLPGFDVAVQLDSEQIPWREWLREQGYDPGTDGDDALAAEPTRPEELSLSAFTTDRLIEWISRQRGSWFTHASYMRPHPPYAAAGRWSRRYDPAEVPPPLPVPDDVHPIHRQALQYSAAAAPTDEAGVRELRAQYYGMVSEVDDQLGRVWAALRALGQWDDTFIVVTADHAEQLGDQGLIQKLLFFESSYHIVGIVRDPRRPEGHGTVVERFTENVDVFPTICDAIGLEVPAQCDGVPLTPFLRGETPPWWRTAAHWEWDWRDVFIPRGEHPWPWDRRLEKMNLAVMRTDDAAYVQFGDGSFRCVDVSDPTWNTPVTDPQRVLALAQELLVWRQQHLDRTMTGMLLQDGGIGRLPPRVQA